MAITSSFANLATVTRASKRTDAGGWDFTNGGSVGTLTEYANGAAAAHPSAGVLIEEATTQVVRNPRSEGGTAGATGSGGALPTYWDASETGYAVAYGTQDGREYTDLIFSGFTPTGDVNIFFEQPTQVAASQGQNWTTSVDAKLLSGALTNVDQVQVAFAERNSGGTAIANNFGSDIKATLDSTARRFFVSDTVGEATAAYVQPYIQLGWTSGAWTFTLRVYHPQLENKAYPTSIVLPTVSSPAAATRAKDVISIPRGSWHNDGSGQTLCVEFVPTQNTAGYILDLVLDSNERIGLRLLSGNARSDISAITNGGSGVGQTMGSVSAGVSSKLAIAFAEDDVAISQTGEAQATDASCDIPDTPTLLMIGAALTSGIAHANCYIKDIRYFPRRVSNAELEAMVGN